MANRFYKTSTPNQIDFVSELPIGLMLRAQQQADQNIDQQQAGLDLSSQLLNINALEPEREAANQWKQQRTEQIDNLAKTLQSNPQNWRQYQWAIKDLQKDVQNDLTTGPASNIIRNYSQYNTYKQQLDEQTALNLKNGNQGIAPFQKEKLLNAAMQQYKQSGESGTGYQFSGIAPAAYVSANETLKNLKDNLKADNIERVQDSVTGQWVWRNTQSGETISPEKVITAAAGKLKGDDRLNAYLTQGGQYGWSKPLADAQGNPVPLLTGNGQLNPNHPYSPAIMGVLGNAYSDQTTAQVQQGENPEFTRNRQSVYEEVEAQLDDDRKIAEEGRAQANAIELEKIKAASAERLARLKGEIKNAGKSATGTMPTSDITTNSTTKITQDLFTEQEKDVNYLRSSVMPALGSQITAKTAELNNATDSLSRERIQADLSGLRLQQNTALSMHNAVMSDVMTSPKFKSLPKESQEAFSEYQQYLLSNATSGKAIMDTETTRKNWIAKKYGLDLSEKEGKVVGGAYAMPGILGGKLGAKNEADYTRYANIDKAIKTGTELATTYSTKQAEANKVVIDGINIASNTETYKLLDQALKSGNIETMNPDIFAGRTLPNGSNPAKQDYQVDANSFLESEGDRFSISNVKAYMDKVGATNLKDIASNVRVLPNTGDGIQLEVTLRPTTLQGKAQGSSSKMKQVQIEGMEGNKITFNISGTSLKNGIVNNLLKDPDVGVREKALYMNDVDALNLSNKLSSVQFYVPQNGNGWSNVQTFKYGNQEYFIRRNQNEIYDVTLSDGTRASFPDASSMRKAIVDYHKSK